MCRRLAAVPPSSGAATVIGKRPTRLLMGLVLLLGVSLAWYWAHQQRFLLGASEVSSFGGLMQTPACCYPGV